MIEHPAIAAVLALIALALALKIQARPPRVLLWVGALLLVGSWIPVVTAGLLDPSGEYIGNGLGLGLLAWFGSTLGLIAAVAGVLWQMTIILLRRAS